MRILFSALLAVALLGAVTAPIPVVVKVPLVPQTFSPLLLVQQIATTQNIVLRSTDKKMHVVVTRSETGRLEPVSFISQDQLRALRFVLMSVQTTGTPAPIPIAPAPAGTK